MYKKTYSLTNNDEEDLIVVVYKGKKKQIVKLAEEYRQDAAPLASGGTFTPGARCVESRLANPRAPFSTHPSDCHLSA